MNRSLSKPLLLSAAPFEAQASMQALVQEHREFDYLSIGIGPFAPAHLNLIKHCQNRSVIFIGTAGTFSPFEKPFLLTTTEAYWLPTCERFGLSYQAGGKLPVLQWKKTPLVQELPNAIAYCSPNVSLQSASETWQPAARVLAVETIELYRVASILLPYAASFSVILGVTNTIGENAHQEWKRNFQNCAEVTAKFLMRQLS